MVIRIPRRMDGTVITSPADLAFADALARGARGALTVDDAEVLLGARGPELERLLDVASSVRDAGDPARVITYSRKVFLPITTLCQDRCHYCIFVDTPAKLATKHKPAYMSPEQILTVARQGAALGCKEALFTLGDRPEQRWPVAREWLDAHGYSSTVHYLRDMARLVLDETGLLPHMNPGVLSLEEFELLRPVAPSMGMMLETTSGRLWSEPGQVHFGSPDKDPAVRLEVLENAGRARVPLTTGILVGIGETLRDRAESLFAIRASHERWGQVQETIVQNFRAKDATAMQGVDDLGTAEYAAAIAVARLVMGPVAVIQAPPNLADAAELEILVRAGVSDWGGVSPLTADHVNPERPWPQIDELARLTADAGYTLRERLTVHDRYVPEWIDETLLPAVEAFGEAATLEMALPRGRAATAPLSSSDGGRTDIRSILELAQNEPAALSDADYAALFEARGEELDALTQAADDLRRYTVGESVSIVENRAVALDAAALTLDEIADIAIETAELGATELCLQGSTTLDPLEIARAVRAGAPSIHLHAFRPADLVAGAARHHLDIDEFLRLLVEAGVDSIPGTGVKLLDDGIRMRIAPTDLPVNAWIRTVVAAHGAGLRSTSIMYYGAGESAADRVAHLRTLREIQSQTGGFTEFVPMPFSEVDLDTHRAVFATSRLMLHGSIPHVQAPWPRVGLETAALLLQSGADDLGGTLLTGTVRPDAGSNPGAQLPWAEAKAITRRLSRTLRRRTTMYGEPARRSGALA
ncbi:7,8-didemethyl-8-hydroxy-5-deazariboflavin synthase CofG [Lysinimonas soli]|uniref:7,8-didemethyl-8-hydroxy-5-deazariboflavin synthase n=1 Tax=Lysinimonas soli TaxID=1074233 RepID=A0ABW0NRI2_9MICO